MELVFDCNVYSLESIEATSYWCADRIVSDITIVDNNIVVKLTDKRGEEVDAAVVADYKMMVLHNQIRSQLQDRFAAIEKAIVEKAFRPVTDQK